MRWATLALTLFIVAVPASALDYPCADNQTSCGGEDLFQGEGSNTGGGYKTPTPTSCEAYGYKGQRCRACEAQYADDGRPTGLTVCAYVARIDSCACAITSNSCTEKGICTYH
jgi:hypothetical protein